LSYIILVSLGMKANQVNTDKRKTMEKERLLQNLKSLLGEIENTTSCKGWKEHHEGSEHDDTVNTFFKAEDYVSNLIEELKEDKI